MIIKYKKNFNLSKNKKLYKYLIFIIFVLGFLIGIFSLRLGYIKNVYYYLLDTPSKFEHFYNLTSGTFVNFEKVYINIKYKDYQTITNNRNRNITQGHAVYSNNDWTKGSIIFSKNNSELNADIRLKGTMSDNWEQDDGRWSFRVKLKNGVANEGMREFSLFRPSVGSGVLEWLFQKIAQEENLLYLRTKIIRLYVNGKDLGYYYLQEHYSKVMVENNLRREGPIVGFAKERIVSLWKSDLEGLLQIDGFDTSNIEISGNYDKLDLNQKKFSKYALNLLEKFRNKELPPNEVFEADQIAKLLAIRAVIGSSDFDWKDIKFFYNPLSGKLEPILREVHAEIEYDTNWWYRGTRNFNSKQIGYGKFEDLIFSDKEIYDKYLKYLKKYLDEDIVNLTIKKYQKDYKSIYSVFALSNDSSKWLELVKIRNKKIKAALNHPDPISANLTDKADINIRNFQFFPVLIKNILIDKKKFFEKDLNLIVEGKNLKEKYYDFSLNILLDKINPEQKIEIIYTIYGLDSIQTLSVSKVNSKNPEPNDLNLYKSYFYEKNNILHNKLKDTVISNTVITPKNFKVLFSPGSTLTFKSTGQLIFLGGVHFNGTKNSRIKVMGSQDSSYGGFFVPDTRNSNIIEYTDFSNLKKVYIDGRLITGSINFYNTKVLITETTFDTNYIMDDFINIVSSEFNISNIRIKNSYADSIDIDFGKGNINNVEIYDSGNDGLDFSGVKSNLNNIYIKNSKDKGISAGENSKINLNTAKITDSNIAIAIKDGSYLVADKLQISKNNYDYAVFVKKNEYATPELNINNSSDNFNYLLGINSKLTVNNKVITYYTEDSVIKNLLY